MNTITVVGSANTDLIIQVDNIPRPGETVLGGKFITASGGKGANQAVAAARLGGKVQFYAAIGQDNFGDKLIKNYRDERIDTHLIQRPKGPSGIAMIYVAKNGENSIVVAPGSNALLTEDNVNKVESAFKKSFIVLTQLEIPMKTVLQTARITKKNNTVFILDPAPAQILPEELYDLTDVITPNEIEASMLTGVEIKGERDVERAASILFDKGVKDVIITLGKKGAMWYSGQTFRLFPPPPAKVIDTTGAGDTFNGALSAALAKGKSMERAIAFANHAAALSTTRLGTQPSIPFLDEIQSE